MGVCGDYSEHIDLVQYRTTVEPLLKEIPEFLLNKTHFLIPRVAIVVLLYMFVLGSTF